MHCNLKVASRPVVQCGVFNNAQYCTSLHTQRFRKGCLAIREHLSVFLAKFVLRVRRNCYFELPVKILTPPLYSAISSDFLYGTNILTINGHLPRDLDL